MLVFLTAASCSCCCANVALSFLPISVSYWCCLACFDLICLLAILKWYRHVLLLLLLLILLLVLVLFAQFVVALVLHDLVWCCCWILRYVGWCIMMFIAPPRNQYFRLCGASPPFQLQCFVSVWAGLWFSRFFTSARYQPTLPHPHPMEGCVLTVLQCLCDQQLGRNQLKCFLPVVPDIAIIFNDFFGAAKLWVVTTVTCKLIETSSKVCLCDVHASWRDQKTLRKMAVCSATVMCKPDVSISM